MSFNQNGISRMVKLFLFFFPLTAGGDKKADAGAGAGGEFQFVSYLRPKWNICVVPVAYQQNLG